MSVISISPYTLGLMLTEFDLHTSSSHHVRQSAIDKVSERVRYFPDLGDAPGFFHIFDVSGDLRDLLLADAGDRDRFIPDYVFELPADQMKSVFDGLVADPEATGEIVRRFLSPRLAHDVVLLAGAVGFTASAELSRHQYDFEGQSYFGPEVTLVTIGGYL